MSFANYFIIIIYYEVFLYFFPNQIFQKLLLLLSLFLLLLLLLLLLLYAFWHKKIRRHLVKGILWCSQLKSLKNHESKPPFTPKLQYSYFIVVVDNAQFSSGHLYYSSEVICLSGDNYFGGEFYGEGTIFRGQFSSAVNKP